MSQELDSVRAELRRLGYLNHRLERYLLQDALRSQPPLEALLRLVVKVALAGGGAVAVSFTLALALANGNLAATPFDLIPLFFHLLPPACLGLGGGFLVLCGGLFLLLHLRPVRHFEALSLAGALGAVVIAAAVLLFQLSAQAGQDLLEGVPLLQRLALVVVVGGVVYGLVRILQDGLLSLSIKLTELAPQQRLFSYRWLVVAVLVGLVLVTLPAILTVGGKVPGAAPYLPSVAGGRVLLVGVDGVLPAELEYLLARGELPALAALAADDGAWWNHAGSEPGQSQVPAVFWSTVATGLPPALHGVTSLDSFRPLGVETPLARNGPLRLYWRRVAVPLGLAEYQPVLSNRRRAFTLWELASRGGHPVAALNWWGTFPAERLPGLVVGHGAYQLLEEDSAGALAGDGELAAEVESLRRSYAASDDAPGFIPLAGSRPILEQAVVPDRFYLEALERTLAAEPLRAAVIYLPALDIALGIDRRLPDPLFFADLLRQEMASVDGAVGRMREHFDAVAVVFHPGRRPGAAGGRILFWSRLAPCAAAPPETTVSPGALTSGLLRLAGLPQSRQLPPPPESCRWPPAPAVIESFGSRATEPAAERIRDQEYLDNLRSLGYL